jgi:histidyl-tRNA synthetase
MGRFREFMQCDFDTIGTESNVADIETLLVIHDLMERIGFERFTVRVNNRLVLNGLLEKLDLTGRTADVLRALDKLPKIGRDAVIAEMTDKAGLTAEQADRVLELASLTGAPDEILARLESLLAGSPTGERGTARLRELFAAARTAGLPPERVALDVSIARGLDYYTGTIYETFLTDLPGIGSVCSGGRYDNLAELFTSQPLPGVGASLGLDRLLAAMEELGLIATASTPAPVLVTVFDAARVGDYLRIARGLRRAGIGAEVFPDVRPIGKQLKYASRKGFRVAVIAGADEFARGMWQVKDLARGAQQETAEADLVGRVESMLECDRPA